MRRGSLDWASRGGGKERDQGWDGRVKTGRWEERPRKEDKEEQMIGGRIIRTGDEMAAMRVI